MTILEYVEDREKIDVTQMVGVDDAAGRAYIDDKTAVFKSLFESQRVGYRGQHTEVVQCPDQYKPEYLERDVTGGKLRYFSTFANARYTVGVCAQQDIRHIAIVAYLHCEGTRTIFEINYFVPIANEVNLMNFIDALNCAQ